MFIGANYQAGVTALIAAHILNGSRLGWIEDRDDIPTAVLTETGGPGDDLRIETAAGPIEVQARRGVRAGPRLSETIRDIAARDVGDGVPIVLVIDRSSSTVHKDVAGDLDRMRSRRSDELHSATARLCGDLGSASEILRRIHIVPCEVERAYDTERKAAIDRLALILFEPARAAEAWAVLVADALGSSARPTRRDRKDLVQFLTAVGISVKPPGADAEWHRQLDFTRQLVERRQVGAALQALRRLEADLRTKQVEGRVWFRLHVQRGAALAFKGEMAEALASACRALESEPNGVHALALATHACVALRDLDGASRYAATAVAEHPHEHQAWLAQAAVSVARGETPPEPPMDVAASAEYRIGRCEIATRVADWEGVLDLSTGLLADQRRDAEVLYHRAQALTKLQELAGEPDRVRAREIERLTTELIRDVDDPENPLSRHGLLLRALARRDLGADAAVDEDLRRANELAPNDPEVIRLLAVRHVEVGRPEQALEVLRHPVVAKDDLLLAMRADLQADMGHMEDAKADLARVEEMIPDSDFPAEAFMRAAGAALALGDVEHARALLDRVSPDRRRSPMFHLVRARLAIADRDLDQARERYLAAANARPALRAGIIAQLGTELFRAGAAREAVAAFDQVSAELPPAARRHYVRALCALGEWARGQAALAPALAQSDPPSWALAEAAQIALRQDDLQSAVGHFNALDARGDLAVDGRVRLVLCLIRLDQTSHISGHLDVLTADPELSPVQQMETAELLRMSGEVERALPLAYRAARRAPTDSKILRAFVGQALTSGVAPPTVTAVAADTYVRLRNESGDQRHYTLLSEGPWDRLRGELPLDDPRARELVGLRVGDQIADHRGAGVIEERWTVAEILPALTRLIREIIDHFHERFPEEPLLARKFSFSTQEPGRVGDFVPFIALGEEKKERVTAALAILEEKRIPLGALVKWLGTSIPVVMAELRSGANAQLVVERGDISAYNVSRASAASAKTVVLTRSALVTAQELGLLDLLASTFKLIAPMSLRDDIRRESEDAEREVRSGQKTMLPGMVLRELAPDHPELVAWRDKLAGLTEWLHREVTFKPRPIELVPPPDTEEDSTRDLVGEASYDAVALALTPDAALYADDDGLRRVAPGGTRPPSFSTIALLGELADRGTLTAQEYAGHALTLVLARYVHVPPSLDLFLAALRRPGIGEPEIDVTFQLLSGPLISLRDAARLGASLVRAVALLPIRIVQPAAIAERILRALARQTPMVRVAGVFWRECARELALLHADRADVEEVCRRAIHEALKLRDAP